MDKANIKIEPVEEAISVTHIKQAQLARRWGISARTLERWRWQGVGPDYLKIGGRAIYAIADIEAFERQQKQMMSQKIVPEYHKRIEVTSHYRKKMDYQKDLANMRLDAPAPMRPALATARQIITESEF